MNHILNLKGESDEYSNVCMFGIYDGHGGYKVSSFLKNNILNLLANKSNTYPIPDDKIYAIYDKIQDSIKKYGWGEIGSTCIVLIKYPTVDGFHYQIINTGDCRATGLTQDNMCIPLTKDHKPCYFHERDRIKAINQNIGNKDKFKECHQDEHGTVRVHDLSVSRAFGDCYAQPQVTHYPDVYHYHDKDYKMIVMGTDGLWDVMSNEDVINFVIEAQQRGVENIAEALSEEAIKKGSDDNISIYVIINH
jgi:serine/threonine protein phosphatase PrpC